MATARTLYVIPPNEKSLKTRANNTRHQIRWTIFCQTIWQDYISHPLTKSILYIQSGAESQEIKAPHIYQKQR